MSKRYARLLLAASAAILGAALGAPSALATPHVQASQGRSQSLTAMPMWRSHGLAARVRRTAHNDEFNGIAALSATNAWAVGNACNSNCGAIITTGRTLIAHWNGTIWTQVSSPKQPNSFLAAVSAASATDIWAAGRTGGGNALILHWNGTAWSIVPNPVADTQSSLAGVAAVSGSDAWAVGYSCPSSSCSALRTLILHWNGTAWTQLPSPSPGGSPFLTAVAAASPTSAWAVGQYCASACGKSAEVDHSLILHWNGSTWTRAPAPSPGHFPELSAVTALSRTDAWAIGDWCLSTCNTSSNVFHTLTLHWNGTKWAQVPSPTPRGSIFGLFGAAATSSTNVWAVGSDNHLKSMTLHWNGTKWSIVSSPNKPNSGTILYGAAAASSSDAWAVGSQGTINIELSTVIMHWNGTAWSIVKSPNP